MQTQASAVLKAAKDRLEKNPHLALRRVRCEFAEGTLVLRGRVTSFYFKQLAQEAIAGLEGVDRINNQIEVVYHPQV